MAKKQDVQRRIIDCVNKFNTISNSNYESKTWHNLQEMLFLLGIKNNIFLETDLLKLKLILSEIIIKKELFKTISSKDYIHACMLLLCYIESLDCNGMYDVVNKPAYNKVHHINDKSDYNEILDALTIAYFLSRFNWNALTELGYHGFRDAFDDIGRIIHRKPATVKNMRDEFDPYFDNGRVGWYQKNLTASRKEIFNKYTNYSFDEMSKIVKDILNSYKNTSVSTTKCDSTKRQYTIKIDSSEMKEIKIKGKKN